MLTLVPLNLSLSVCLSISLYQSHSLSVSASETISVSPSVSVCLFQPQCLSFSHYFCLCLCLSASFLSFALFFFLSHTLIFILPPFYLHFTELSLHSDVLYRRGKVRYSTSLESQTQLPSCYINSLQV